METLDKKELLIKLFQRTTYREKMISFLMGFKDKDLQLIYSAINPEYKIKRKLTAPERKVIKNSIIYRKITAQDIWRILG